MWGVITDERHPAMVNLENANVAENDFETAEKAECRRFD